MNALTAPTPRFQIGDTIWVVNTVSETVKLPCPDCHGSHTWKVTTPAGTEMETPCLRCGDYSNTNLPPLTYRVQKGIAESRQITGLEIEADPRSTYDEPVRYRCRAGGSSYWTVNESAAYATEAAALAVAQQMAAEKNAEIEARAEVLDIKRIGTLPMNDARFNEFKNGLWDSWYAARQWREYVEGLKEDPKLPENLREDIAYELRFEDEYRTQRPLEKLVRACEALGDAAPESVKAALAELPKFAHAALLADTLAEAEAFAA